MTEHNYVHNENQKSALSFHSLMKYAVVYKAVEEC